MGMGDIRSYTANSPVNTPNLDRIANAGMRFTNAQAPSSVCSPTRYGILTGAYGFRSSLQSGVVLPFQRSMIDYSRTTLPEMLRTTGYSTAIFGKWHEGLNWVTNPINQNPSQFGSNIDFTQPFTNGPLDHGFDTYFGIAGSASEGPYAFIRDNRVVGADLSTPCSASAPGSCPVGLTQGNPFSATNVAGPVTPGFSTQDVLPTITNEALSYIGQRANQGNPFFAYMPINAPHEPIVPPSSANGQSGVSGPKQGYGDFLLSVDTIVGQVLDKLADPDGNPQTPDSVLENTIVVFTADNGYASQWGFNTSAGKINGTPLRGSKALVYEGGTRVPYLTQWTGHIPAGTVNNNLMQLNDFMATVKAITGATLPASAAEDSINMLPELTGTATSPLRTAGVTHSANGTYSIRQFDSANNEWKLTFTPGNGDLSDNQKVDPKANITNFTKLQLYNLTSDPGEQANLLAGGGSLAMQQKALQLQGVLRDYLYAGRSVNIPPRTGTNGVSAMLVDFGQTSRQTSLNGWNNVSGAEATRPNIAMGLYDQGGGYTGIVLKTSWVGSGFDSGVGSLANAYNGPAYPSQLTGYPWTALSDDFYVRNGNTLTITLESLDAHATYDLLFYGAASSGPEMSLFTVTGSTVEQVSISPLVNNSTKVATVSGMMPDSLNRIQILFEGRHADGSLGGAGFLNFMRIVEHLLEIPGDYNNDRLVDMADYASWRSAFGETGTNLADGNHDGVVDMADYVVWRHAYTSWTSGPAAGVGNDFSPVPEPSSLVGGVSLVGMIALSHRWRKSR